MTLEDITNITILGFILGIVYSHFTEMIKKKIEKNKQSYQAQSYQPQPIFDLRPPLQFATEVRTPSNFNYSGKPSQLELIRNIVFNDNKSAQMRITELKKII
jgi:hypothetical protein